MEKNKNNYCLILAGGRGRRLWPYSRDKRPKQFIDFFGCGRTQLQSTFDRFACMLPKENIFVFTNRDYLDLVSEQLPELDSCQIMAEPVNRNTAPSVAWGVTYILKRNAEANVVVTPSDLFVLNEHIFDDNVLSGLDYVASHEDILTMGVKPTRPEPGYGYIQMGNATETEGVFRVRSFTEKPERDFAKVFMESGEFQWNTGLFLGSARCLNETMKRLFPDVQPQMERLSGGKDCGKGFEELYSSYPNLSIDYAVLERSDNVCVMECNFGWADLGTWHSIYECKQKGEDDNVVIDSNVIIDNSHNNVIKLPKGMLGVVGGLDGYIVVQKDNVLLICKKGDSSALVRKYVNEAQMKYGDEFI
jgi:mannose-1-phosphate guanylyltransferase